MRGPGDFSAGGGHGSGTLALRGGAFACPWAGLALPFGRGRSRPGSVRRVPRVVRPWSAC